jgi:hypothetical protein
VAGVGRAVAGVGKAPATVRLPAAFAEIRLICADSARWDELLYGPGGGPPPPSPPPAYRVDAGAWRPLVVIEHPHAG